MKKFSLLIAVFAVFAMTAVSFAANTATLNITSEPIRQFAKCDKAGGIVGSFDVGTTFRGGDQITFDLDFGVTLCKDIDFEAGHQSALDHVYPLGWNGAGVDANYVLPLIGVNNPLTEEALAPFHGSTGTNIANPNPDQGIFFHVHGQDGSARVTIDVLTYDATSGSIVWGADNTIVATVVQGTDANTDKMTFAFLDQVVYAPSAHTGLFVPDAAGDYTVIADKADNTLCIDVSQMAASITTFDGNFDSKGDKYTWLPSDPQIAHVVESNAFLFQECKGRVLGRTVCETAGGQFSSAYCVPIENEMDATGSEADGFCYNYTNDAHQNNKIIIRTANGSPFEAVNYNVTLTLLVDGVEGEFGAYWSNGDVLTEGYTNADDACDATNADGTAIGTYEYYDVDGDPVTAVSDTDCYIAPANRATTLVAGGSDGSTLGLTASDDFLYINLPDILQDSSLAGAISVEVTLSKAPCGEIFSGVWDISEAACCAPSAQSGESLYPYFAKSTGDFVNVLIVDNVGSTDGTFVATIYEDDGDVFVTNAQAVAAGGMYVSTLLNLPVTDTNVEGSGTLGDARCFVKVSAGFATDGSAWIVKPSTGESFGYICRLLGI